jgi:hypothetical protein
VDSQLYPHAREMFALGQLNWTAGVMRGLFLPESYHPNFDLHQFLSDIPLNLRVAISAPITGRTAAKGVCTGNHITFPLLFDNRLVNQAVIYKDTGVEGTSVLVAYLGEDELVTDPFIPLGLDYYIYPDAALGGFFRL